MIALFIFIAFLRLTTSDCGEWCSIGKVRPWTGAVNRSLIVLHASDRGHGMQGTCGRVQA
jgi:hypothetical protein